MSQYIGNDSKGMVEVCTPQRAAGDTLLVADSLDPTKASFKNPTKLTVNGPVSVIPTVNDGIPYSEVLDEATTNFIVNPSFEVNVTDGWAPVGSPTVTQDLTSFLWGAASMKILTSGAAGDGVRHQNVSAIAGITWCFSAHAVWDIGYVLRFQIEFLDASFAVLQSTTRDETSQNNSWFGFYGGTVPINRFYVAATAPTRTAWVRVSVLNPNATARTISLDGVQLERDQSTPTSYCDGSLSPLGSSSSPYQWNGAAHFSTSSRAAGRHIIGALQPSSDPVIAYDNGITNFQGEFRIGGNRTQVRISGSENSNGVNIETVGTDPSLPLSIYTPHGEPVSVNFWNFRWAGSGNFGATPYVAGDLVFRTDDGVVYQYNGTKWLSVAGAGAAIQTKATNTIATTATTATKAVAGDPAYAAGAEVLTLAFTMKDRVNNGLIVDVSCGSIQNSISGDYSQLVVMFDNSGGTGNLFANGGTTCVYSAVANVGATHACKVLCPPNFFAQAATVIRVLLFGAAAGTRTLNSNGTVQNHYSALVIEAREVSGGYN